MVGVLVKGLYHRKDFTRVSLRGFRRLWLMSSRGE
jgi:hypothetical protein